ncbi:Rha family transcriptional regulator [Pseudomonas moraviensis]|uniref:Rha family transcriptional regulator n=1 Tax=Pseudomonas moraviensis TaxID=321662 RepID=UPI0037FDEF9E
MHSSPDAGNTLSVATRFSNSENVSRTSMSSQEIAELVGSRHDKVKQSIERLAERGTIQLPPMGEVRNHLGQTVSVYQVCKRDSFVVVAQLSPEFTAALVDRWQELEGRLIAALPDFTNPAAAARAWADQVEQKQAAEQARVLLCIEVQAQAKKIDHLENLFKEGESAAQFCKQLNGVNVMQVNAYLKQKNWLFTEGRFGTRWRVTSYGRDRYMTEHHNEITPHGKEAFIVYTPILLRKGAARLYDLYLAGKLPMKKTWDGLFTHDKALRGAA